MSPLGALLALASAEAGLAILFGGVYWGLSLTYPRRDLRLWALAWGWLLVHIAGVMADGAVASVAATGPWRMLTLAVLVVSSNLGLLSLLEGIWAFTGDESAPQTLRRRQAIGVALGALTGLVAGSGVVPAAWQTAASEGVRASLAAALMATGTIEALRYRRWDGPGSVLTQAGLAGITLMQSGYAILATMGTPAIREAWLPYLTIVDWLLWVVLGVGAITWLLHRERTMAAEGARARQALEENLVARERRFAAIIDGITERIFIVDAAGRLAYSAPRPLMVDAFSPADLEGQPFEAFIHPDDVADARGLFGRILAHPDLTLSARLRVRSRAGSWNVYEFQARNLLADPSVSGVLVTARDVTERARLEAQLHDAQRMESIGRLAGGVAHDFNNLLTVIAANAEFGRSLLAADAPAHAELAQIESAAERAATLTRQLLSFARRQIVEPRTIALDEVVESLGAMVRRLAGGHIVVTMRLAAARSFVRADRGQLEQVLLNLVANARDAMPDGGELTIATGRTRVTADLPVIGLLPGTYATVSVVDTGTGMPDDVKAHAFEPFFTTKDVGAGTGLGLASCYGVVTQHGGHIAVESAVGRGSTFTIYLPEVEGEAPAATAPQATAAGAGGHERVLLVEDEAGVRRVATQALRTRGFEVIEAADGVEAWQRLQTEAVDCIVSDVAMPRLGGPALVRQLRVEHARLPVVLTSGYMDHAAVTALLDEVTEFLPKPYTGEQLAAKVRRIVDRLAAARP